MHYPSLQSLLDAKLQEIYAAEAHVAREIKHFVDGAASSEIKSQLVKHGEETAHHAESLAAILKKRNLDPHQAKCRVIDVLIKKGHDIIQSRGSDALLDLGLVLTMRAIDTFEQCSYEEARPVAEALGEGEVVQLLEKHLREEGQQERSWMVLAEDMIDALVSVSANSKQPPAQGVGGVHI
jgi:ferritin-like metal-binding protein YciE